nr:hypothetical protein [Tanacetum cinerariifolium]
MEILSRLKDVEMIRMNMKNPPLDQTEGQREEGMEKNPSLLVHQRRRLSSFLRGFSPSYSTKISLKRLVSCYLVVNLMSRGVTTPGSTVRFQADEPIHADEELEEPALQEFDIGFIEEQPVDEITQHPDWFKKPSKPTTPDRVESYQKELNLTKPDTYRSDLKRKEAYQVYSSPRGFIYQNKDKKNRLMRIDELHKFSDGTLNDVRTALDDHLKGIRMKFLPQTI